MAALLALLAAVGYGAGDFSAGLASREFASGPVAATTQALGLVALGAAVLLFPGHGPRESALLWGALSGVGGAVGTFSLYHGLSIARMSVVATLSAVLTAVIPALVGLALGNHLSTPAAVGVVIAVPALVLVSWQPAGGGSAPDRSGIVFGTLAGAGFALLFIALDRAGTRSGAWPLVPAQAVSFLLIAPVAVRWTPATGPPSRRAVLLMAAAGLFSITASILFLAATGHGQLAVVAVLTALYPGVTVVLARVFLSERWSSRQAVGMVGAAIAIVLVSRH